MAPSTAVDLIVHAYCIVPIEPVNTVLHHHSLIVHQKQIVDILPTSDAKERYSSNNVYDLSVSHVLMPGLINGHTHVGMTLLRGFSDDLNLSDWLTKEIWPVEGKFVSPAFVECSILLGQAELLLSGCTTINEMYFYPDTVAQTIHDIGARATVGIPLLEFPTMYASNPEDYLQKGVQLLQKWKGHDRIHIAIAPHAPYTVSDASWKKALQLANEHDLQIHTHLHETRYEVEHSSSGNGHAKHISNQLCSPLDNFDRLGLLSSRLIAAHMTALSDADIQVLAKRQVNIAHCPHSNLKLASGFCPTDKLLKLNVNVSIGTDGAASNNRLDMFAELKTASILSKAVNNNPEAFTAFQALYAATMGGARALNIHKKVGSLVKGKQADFIAVDLNHLQLLPIYNVVSHLAYAVDGSHVTHTWVNGKILVDNRRLTTIDNEKLIADVQQWQEKMAAYKAANAAQATATAPAHVEENSSQLDAHVPAQ